MIQIKAKQQNVSFEKNVEKLAFVLSAHLYNTLGADGSSQALRHQRRRHQGCMGRSRRSDPHLGNRRSQRATARTRLHAIRRSLQEREERRGREDLAHHRTSRHLHPIEGGEGRAAVNQDRHHLLRQGRQHRQACHLCRHRRRGGR